LNTPICQLLRSRLLEAGDLHALRIDARHDVLDRAVLAGCVHCLEYAQDGPLILRVQQFLQGGEAPHTISQQRLACGVIHQSAADVGGIVVLQAEAFARIDAIAADEPAQPFLRHGAATA
jgi:hypothetical protein